MIEILLYGLVLLVLLIGSYTDLRTREIPDFLTYGLVFVAFGIRIIFSFIYQNPVYFLEGLFGFIPLFLIALAMFYTGQWGGGDSKLIMGIGASIGLKFVIDSTLVAFFINTIIFGALFGLIYSAFLIFRNIKKFKKEFIKFYDKNKKKKYLVWAATILILIIAYFSPFYIKVPLVTLSIIALFSFYVFIFMKSIERAVMIKRISPERLTEGDWIVKDIIIDGKTICGPKDLGIEKKQIKQLITLKAKGKVKKILVKDGIPFVPSFLIAFVMTLIFGNVIFRMIGI